MFEILLAELWSSCSHGFSWETLDWFIKFVMIFYLQSDELQKHRLVETEPLRATCYCGVIPTRSVLKL